MMNLTSHCCNSRRQRGVVAVEFALLAIVFFTVLFGIIELGRYIFLRNTLQEVTRHAARDAAVADFSDSSAMAAIGQHALFRTTPGLLVFTDNIRDTNVQIDYLSFEEVPVTPLPACPAANAISCLDNPRGASCIRFVRVRICADGTSCLGVPYVPMVGLMSILFPSGDNALRMPLATTLTPIESLKNFSPGSPGCP